MKAPGCIALVIGLIVLGWVIEFAKSRFGFVIVLFLAVGIVLAIAAALRGDGNAKKAQDDEYRSSQAMRLERLGRLLPNAGTAPISLKKGEIYIYRVDGVELVESRSNGSKYVGGSRGVSLKVMKGVTYRVGASRGQLVKNPETLQVIDRGFATFTNQRVVFAGTKASREWAFDKIINVDVTGNGQQVMLAVSNRQKPSGLQSSDFLEISPGILVAVANDFYELGLEGARERCLNTAAGLRAISSGASASEATDIANPGQSSSESGREPLESEPAATQQKSMSERHSVANATAGSDDLYLAEGAIVDVVGESFYKTSFDAIRSLLNAEVGETVETTVTLNAEPFNKYSKNGNAVSVQKNGLILGHISEDENSEFFDLLKNYNGRGVCDAEIYFAPEEEVTKNSVRLLCEFPPEAR